MRTPLTTAACVTALLAACSVLTACGDEEVVDAAPVFALDRDVATDIADVAPDRGPVVDAPSLRMLLQSLLTQHATLSNEAMRRSIDGGDRTDVLARLTENTDALTAAIGLVYGPDGAHAFDQLWTNHIEFFDDYAAAIEAGDEAGAAVILGELGHYETDFSDFVGVATGGNLDRATALEVLHQHVGQLIGQAEAWNEERYDDAYASATEGYRHMGVIAAALAAGIGAQQPLAFPGSADAPPVALCADANLSVGRSVAARADLEWAERLGPRASVDAARDASETALADALSWLSATDVARLNELLDSIDDATEIPSWRAQVLAQAAQITPASCAA